MVDPRSHITPFNLYEQCVLLVRNDKNEINGNPLDFFFCACRDDFHGKRKERKRDQERVKNYANIISNRSKMISLSCCGPKLSDNILPNPDKLSTKHIILYIKCTNYLWQSRTTRD